MQVSIPIELQHSLVEQTKALVARKELQIISVPVIMQVSQSAFLLATSRFALLCTSLVSPESFTRAILQACVKMRLSCTHRILNILLKYLFEGFGNRQPLNKLTPEPLSWLVTAVAAANHPFPAPYVHQWAKQCDFRLEEFRLSELAAIVVACQMLNINPMGGHFSRRIFELHPELLKLQNADFARSRIGSEVMPDPLPKIKR